MSSIVHASHEFASLFPELSLGPSLGQGAFGQVYKCEFKAETYALKIVKQRVSTLKLQEQARFFRETNLLARLNHEALPRVYDYGIRGDYLYCIMDFFPAGPLSQRIAVTPISNEETLQLGIKTAEALTLIHGIGLIHRDIKPDNLLVSKDFTSGQVDRFWINR